MPLSRYSNDGSGRDGYVNDALRSSSERLTQTLRETQAEFGVTSSASSPLRSLKNSNRTTARPAMMPQQEFRRDGYLASFVSPDRFTLRDVSPRSTSMRSTGQSSLTSSVSPDRKMTFFMPHIAPMASPHRAGAITAAADKASPQKDVLLRPFSRAGFVFESSAHKSMRTGRFGSEGTAPVNSPRLPGLRVRREDIV